MGFLPDAPRDVQGTQLASQLCQILVRERKLQRSPDIAAWGREFDTLLRTITNARIHRVLDWYSQSVSKPYTPRAYSASQFRAKFEQLEAAITETQDSNVVIPAEYVTLAERMARDRSWPVELLASLPLAIKEGRTNLASFVQALYAARQSCEDRARRFITHLLEGKVYPTWVEDEWLELCHKSYGWMDHYTGPVQVLFFSANSDRFRDSFWHQWSLDWCGSHSAFDPLLSQVTR